MSMGLTKTSPVTVHGAVFVCPSVDSVHAWEANEGRISHLAVVCFLILPAYSSNLTLQLVMMSAVAPYVTVPPAPHTSPRDHQLNGHCFVLMPVARNRSGGFRFMLTFVWLQYSTVARSCENTVMNLWVP
jgi:hypothetical protein